MKTAYLGEKMPVTLTDGEIHISDTFTLSQVVGPTHIVDFYGVIAHDQQIAAACLI